MRKWVVDPQTVLSRAADDKLLNGMVWDPTTMMWKGNDSALEVFEGL